MAAQITSQGDWPNGEPVGRLGDPDDLASRAYDLIVIGAGCTGLDHARDALGRGLRVLVIDSGSREASMASTAAGLEEAGVEFRWRTHIVTVERGLGGVRVRTGDGFIRAAKAILAVDPEVDRLSPEMAEEYAGSCA